MWHLNKIPKIMHCYWGSSAPLSYLRFLTVATFSKLNPDWEIRVYTTKEKVLERTWKAEKKHAVTKDYAGPNYFNKLEELCLDNPNITINEVNFSETVVSGAHDVQKSDFLRWELLRDIGGLWSDFDIIYFKSMQELVENNLLYSDKSLFLSRYNRSGSSSFAIGFLMSEQGNPTINKCTDFFESAFSKQEFQSGGSSLLKSVTVESSDDLIFMDQFCVYPIIYNELNQLFNGVCNNWDSSVGFHWYGGARVMEKVELDFSESLFSVSEENIEKRFKEIVEHIGPEWRNI